jgi:hypothetical protein
LCTSFPHGSGGRPARPAQPTERVGSFEASLRALPTLPPTIRRSTRVASNSEELPQAGLCRKRADWRRAARARVTNRPDLQVAKDYACTSCNDTSSPSVFGPSALKAARRSY